MQQEVAAEDGAYCSFIIHFHIYISYSQCCGVVPDGSFVEREVSFLRVANLAKNAGDNEETLSFGQQQQHTQPHAIMLRTLALAAAGLGLIASAQTLPVDIVGTWSTKSNKTLTGPVCLLYCCSLATISADMIPTGLLRPHQRQVHRTRPHRNLILLHRRWLL